MGETLVNEKYEYGSKRELIISLFKRFVNSQKKHRIGTRLVISLYTGRSLGFETQNVY